MKASRGWCGSSLHGWILAAGLPRVGLALAEARVGGKLAAWIDTWEPHARPRLVEPCALGEALTGALSAPACAVDMTPPALRIMGSALA